MRRSGFIVGLGGAAALSIACWSPRLSAQQRTPVIGVLTFGMPESSRLVIQSPAFTQALKDADLYRAKTWRSNSAMRQDNLIACRR
jgi:hypothetical protein